MESSNPEIRVTNKAVQIGEKFYIYLDKDFLSPGDLSTDKTIEILSKPRLVRKDGIFSYKYEISPPKKSSPINVGDFFIEGAPIEIEDYRIPTFEELTPGTIYEELIPKDTYRLVMMDFGKNTPEPLDIVEGNDPYWIQKIVPYTFVEAPKWVVQFWEDEIKHLIENKQIRIRT